MKKRDIFLPSISTLLIFGLVVFLSCAHQNRVQDEFGNEVEQTQEQVSENTEGTTEAIEEGAEQATATTDELSQNADTGVDELTQAANESSPSLEQPPGDATATTTAEATTPPGSPEAELGLESNSSVTATQPTEADQLLGSTETTPPMDTTAATGADPLAIPPVDTLAQSEPPAEHTPSEPSTPSTFESSHPVTPYSGTSHAPVIPTTAVSKKGVLLNRFYFARKSDTPAKVSELVYGNAGQSKNLRKWNAGGWAPGKVIYYNSPSSPDDTQMKSFYQEKNISPEEYTVEKGDWLSKVAEKKLGHSKSWKEIAVINGMDSPDKLEVGQRIAIYPLDLQSAPTQTEQLAQMDQEQPIAQAQPVVPPAQEPTPQAQQPTPQLAQPEQPVVPPVQEPITAPVEAPKKKAKLESVPEGNVIEQNLFFILIGGGILALLGALMLVNKRKKARAEEFGEEGFPAPTKLKRK